MVKTILESTDIPKDKKVIIDFFATWCGPCQKIAPFFEELTFKYPTIEFIKVDVDEGEDIAEKMDILSLPTFLFMENGSVITKFEGSDFHTLSEMVENFSKDASEQDSTKENIDPNK
jgi:thioredoxin 1